MAEIHIGHIIKTVLDEQGRKTEWFATQMHCNRTNVYKIFEKKHLNTQIIVRASKVLSHDFFLDISRMMMNT